MSNQSSDDSNSVYSDEGSNAQAASGSEDSSNKSLSPSGKQVSTLSHLSDSDSDQERNAPKSTRKDIIKVLFCIFTLFNQYYSYLLLTKTMNLVSCNLLYKHTWDQLISIILSIFLYTENDT